jgi:hypothetical protein
MVHENNPQAGQMADESMVRNLSAQAEAIWPQEESLAPEVDELFRQVIDIVLDPDQYAVWHVPVISARKSA